MQLGKLGLHGNGKASRLLKTNHGACVLWIPLLGRQHWVGCQLNSTLVRQYSKIKEQR